MRLVSRERNGSKQRRVYVSAESSAVYIKNVISVDVSGYLDVDSLHSQRNTANVQKHKLAKSLASIYQAFNFLVL